MDIWLTQMLTLITYTTLIIIIGRFRVKCTLLPKYISPHCMQTQTRCVVLIQCDVHVVAVIRNIQAIFHEDT